MRRRSTPRFALIALTGILLVAPATSPSVAAEEPNSTRPATVPEAPAAPQATPDLPGTERTPETPSAAPANEKAPTPAPSAPVTEKTSPAAPSTPAPSISPDKAPAVAVKSNSAADPVSTPEELRFVELANEERRKRGLSQLVIDPLLIRVARLHSAEMRDRAYFNHNSPTAAERTPMDRYLKAVSLRPEYACVGENLFYCSIVDVKRGHDAFMNSPTHRDNVLFPRYEKIGVGIIKNERGEFWVTQMYLTNTDPQIFARQMVKNK
ncbi:MAG: CAP domain-containing protein [Actinomycetota bacterium]